MQPTAASGTFSSVVGSLPDQFFSHPFLEASSSMKRGEPLSSELTRVLLWFQLNLCSLQWFLLSP